jgi:hypothetical protein
MPIVMSDAWCGLEVTYRLEEVIFQSQVHAATYADGKVGILDLAWALLEPATQPSLAIRAVGLLGCTSEQISAVRANINTVARKQVGGGDVDTLQCVPDAELIDALADAKRLQLLTRNSKLTTAHCLATITEAMTARLSSWKKLEISRDNVLQAATQYSAVETGDEQLFTNVNRDVQYSVPPPPAREDFATRATGSRSPFVANLFKGVLPSGKHLSSPLAIVQMRWFAIATQTHLLATYILAAGILVYCIGPGPWWAALAILPIMAQPTAVPMPAWFVGNCLTYIVLPQHLDLLVVIGALAAFASSRSELWMKRVDLGEPAWSWRDGRKEQRQHMRRVVLERFGVDDADE